MLSPWLEIEGVRNLVEQWSDAIELDLLHLGCDAGADEIRDTAHAQPLIVALGVISWHCLRDRYEKHLESSGIVMAGHSVGEITVAAISETISEMDAMKFVGKRGSAMAAASAQVHTGMSAVIGGDRESVINALRSFDLIAANENGANQIVAAGLKENLERLQSNPPEGSRIRPLDVAGAFHTDFMKGAEDQIRAFTPSIPVSHPKVQLLSNRDGEMIRNGSDFLARVVDQISQPVRWDLCMKKINDLKILAAIELAPGGTLTNLIKREIPEVRTFALKTPDDLEKIDDLWG